MLDTYGRKYVQPTFNKIGEVAIKRGISPVKITIGAFVMGMLSVVAIVSRQPILAVVLLWISGSLDVLDGTVARLSHSKSNIGAFLDITFDRVVETGIIIALVMVDRESGFMLAVLSSMIVLSITVFLTVGNFAKNTGKKAFYYQAGAMERTEGFIFFTLMILFSEYRITIGFIFAGLIAFTALQRFVEGIRILSKGEDING